MNSILDKYVERQVFCPGELMFQCGQTEQRGQDLHFGEDLADRERLPRYKRREAEISGKVGMGMWREWRTSKEIL